MSSILQDLSIHLRDLLITALNTPASPFTVNNISLNSPVEFAEGTSANGVQLSLYLFHIQRNEHLNNQQMIRVGGQQFHRPLYVDLSYLLTPVRKADADNLLLMGRCMQIFHANGTLRAPFLRPSREPDQNEARLHLLQYDLEAMHKLWGALSKPYRMSVAYLVSPIPIESVSPPQAGPPVTEALLDLQQVAERG